MSNIANQLFPYRGNRLPAGPRNDPRFLYARKDGVAYEQSGGNADRIDRLSLYRIIGQSDAFVRVALNDPHPQGGTAILRRSEFAEQFVQTSHRIPD